MYVGARKATLPNIVFNGESYELDPYFLLGAHLRTLDLQPAPGHTTEVSLHVENLLDTQYAHGGNWGVDIPGVGRSVFLRVKHEFLAIR